MKRNPVFKEMERERQHKERARARRAQEQAEQPPASKAEQVWLLRFDKRDCAYSLTRMQEEGKGKSDLWKKELKVVESLRLSFSLRSSYSANKPLTASRQVSFL